ncbi:MAG: hypothetical protein KDA22_08490 [Phycisphaerales bacterium]|nr:hypothetical protein [Phycisphaerales bacterium]
MTPPPASIIVRLLAGCLVASVALTACEDRTARQQTAARSTISNVVASYGTLRPLASLASDPEGLDSTRNRLTALLNELSSIEGASPGQEAAVAALSASMRSDLAGIAVARLSALEAEQVRARSIANSMIDASLLLDALATADEAFDVRNEEAELGAVRAAAEKGLANIQVAIRDLDGPIGSLEDANRDALAAAVALDQQSRDLKRMAVDAGAADGFPYFEQAAMKRREADKLRIDAARNDIQLAELEPQRRLAQSSADGFQSLIAAVGSAKSGLQQFANDTKARAADNRKTLDSLRGSVQALVKTMLDVSSGEMSQLYEQAGADLEKAASLAGRGAAPQSGRDGSTSAKLAVASARQAQAQMEWMRARGLQGSVQLLGRLVSAGGTLGDPAALKTMLDEATTAHTAAVERTKELLNSTVEAIDQSGADESLTAPIKVAVTESIAALSGATIDPSAPGKSGAVGGSGRGFGGAPGASGGEESPEAVLAALQALGDSSIEEAPRFFALMKASSPSARQTLAAMAVTVETMGNLLQAVEDTFGPGAADSPESKMVMPSTAFVDATVTSQTDTRATIGGPSMPDGRELDLVRSGGKWFIDADSFLGGLKLPFDPQMMGMLDAIKPMMKSAADDVAGRVRAGEFADAKQAMAAFQEAMMKKVMEGAASGTLPGAVPGG